VRIGLTACTLGCGYRGEEHGHGQNQGLILLGSEALKECRVIGGAACCAAFSARSGSLSQSSTISQHGQGQVAGQGRVGFGLGLGLAKMGGSIARAGAGRRGAAQKSVDKMGVVLQKYGRRERSRRDL
jgi:hypothetical protein